MTRSTEVNIAALYAADHRALLDLVEGAHALLAPYVDCDPDISDWLGAYSAITADIASHSHFYREFDAPKKQPVPEPKPPCPECKGNGESRWSSLDEHVACSACGGSGDET